MGIFRTQNTTFESGMNSHVGKPLDMRVLMREILKYTHRS